MPHYICTGGCLGVGFVQLILHGAFSGKGYNFRWVEKTNVGRVVGEIGKN